MDKRIQQLQTGNSQSLDLVYKERSDFPRELEKNVHKNLSKKRRKGEFFDITSEIAQNTINLENKKIDDRTYMLPDENGEFSNLTSDKFLMP